MSNVAALTPTSFNNFYNNIFSDQIVNYLPNSSLFLAVCYLAHFLRRCNRKYSLPLVIG